MNLEVDLASSPRLAQQLCCVPIVYVPASREQESCRYVFFRAKFRVCNMLRIVAGMHARAEVHVVVCFHGMMFGLYWDFPAL